MASVPPIKILHIVSRLNVGGPAIHVLSLSEDLPPERFETLVIYGQVAPGEEEMIGYRGLDASRKFFIPELGRELHPIRDISTLIKLIRIIRRERPDIVHSHAAKAGAVGRAAAWLCRVPVIVHTYHGHVFKGYFSPLRTSFFVAIEKMLAHITTRIIAISPRQLEEISDILNVSRERFALVPLGFDLSRFSYCRSQSGDEFRDAVTTDPAKKIVSIIGRITAIKNHRLFVDAAATVCEKRNDVLFVIVGDGEDREMISAYAKEQGLSDSIVFAGWWKDIEKVYAGTDITVLTSINEGTPVCLIESLASGVPVVSTDVGGVSDIVRNGETGFVVPPGDAQAIAASILTLLDNQPLCSMMGKVGMSDMQSRYSFTRLASDITHLYNTLSERKDK